MEIHNHLSTKVFSPEKGELVRLLTARSWNKTTWCNSVWKYDHVTTGAMRLASAAACRSCWGLARSCTPRSSSTRSRCAAGRPSSSRPAASTSARSDVSSIPTARARPSPTSTGASARRSLRLIRRRPQGGWPRLEPNWTLT
eukprot:2508560-Prymnesium_polylepis.2